MLALARRSVAVVAVLFAILAPASLFYGPLTGVQSWRESIFETAADLLGGFVMAKAQAPVRLVAIDQETAKRYGPWPWSQEQLGALLDQIQKGSPRLILMNIGDEPAAGNIRNWDRAQLDARLKGHLAQVQSSWRADNGSHIPLISAEGDLIRPAPVALDAMSILRIGKLRIDGESARSDWNFSTPGIRALAPPAPAQAWPTTEGGSLRLLTAEAPTGLKALSAWRIMRGQETATKDLKGAVVVVRHVGALSPATLEWREAQALAQILNGLMPERPLWAPMAEVLAAALAAGIVSLLMVLGLARRALAIAGAAILGFFLVAVFLFVTRLELIEPVSMSSFVLGALALSGLALVLRRSLGANAAAPDASPSHLAPMAGVERREVTALVCQIRDLPALTETYRDSPVAMTRLIGKVLGTAGEIIRAHRGTIEQIGPDGIRAVFNAPGADPRHGEKAAEAALAVLGRLDPLNEALEKSLASTGPGFTPINFSIGIDTGDAVIGDIGFKSRKEFAAFGPAIEGALELASLSKTYGPAILVGDKTEALISRNFALLELDLREASSANVRSFYALLGNPVLRANPRFKALQEGFRAFHAAYRTGTWEQAMQLLEQCAKLPGVSPKLIALYGDRITYLHSLPAIRDWTGILRRPIE